MTLMAHGVGALGVILIRPGVERLSVGLDVPGNHAQPWVRLGGTAFLCSIPELLVASGAIGRTGRRLRVWRLVVGDVAMAIDAAHAGVDTLAEFIRGDTGERPHLTLRRCVRHLKFLLAIVALQATGIVQLSGGMRRVSARGGFGGASFGGRQCYDAGEEAEADKPPQVA